jgi:hypothetical protein
MYHYTFCYLLGGTAGVLGYAALDFLRGQETARIYRGVLGGTFITVTLAAVAFLVEWRWTTLANLHKSRDARYVCMMIGFLRPSQTQVEALIRHAIQKYRFAHARDILMEFPTARIPADAEDVIHTCFIGYR